MKICLACSQGGHLTETEELLEAFDGHQLLFLSYSSVRTKELPNAYLIENFVKKPSKFPSALLTILSVFLSQKPDLIVSTGAEIAIPVFLVAKVFGVKTMFIETCARIYKPSGTGRIAYPFSDYFFVQWRELLQHYGRKARYEGGLL